MGILSVHLDGAPCAVGCPFCYLGARDLLRKLHPRAANDFGHGVGHEVVHGVDELVAAAERFDYAELAIAVSEPVDEAAITRLIDVAVLRERPVALTTTAQIVLAHPSLFARVTRLSLSVDPWKMPGDDEALIECVRRAVSAVTCEVVAIATLSTPAFAQRLVDGLLARLVDLPELAAVALNALKPPPPFCDRAFWLDTLARLRPLLDRALDRRLFLDCYVAARLLRLGGCPGRADVSPSANGLQFRSCVYAATPDCEGSASELAARAYVAPAECPFDTRLA